MHLALNKSRQNSCVSVSDQFPNIKLVGKVFITLTEEELSIPFTASVKNNLNIHV